MENRKHHVPAVVSELMQRGVGVCFDAADALSSTLSVEACSVQTRDKPKGHKEPRRSRQLPLHHSPHASCACLTEGVTRGTHVEMPAPDAQLLKVAPPCHHILHARGQNLLHVCPQMDNVANAIPFLKTTLRRPIFYG